MTPVAMGRLLQASLLLAAALPWTWAQNAPSCNSGNPCPKDTPCCSQYGQCGTGAYCLGGCDPISSFSLDACVPNPVCQDKSFDFNNIDNVMPNTKYLGDATKVDWVSSGEPVAYDNTLLLTMAQGTVGTLMASAHYVWYGKIKARLRTSAGAGVVTAFILMSDAKDEIDFEFVGTELTTAQTNFYSLGVTNYDNGGKSTISSDSMANYHDYEIDWQVDQLTWSIDGKVIRTLKRADTWNSTSNRFTYPQTPSRVQLSLWPAGLPTNPKGTVEWAGGEISWNSEYMTNGYYYAQFDSLSIECADPPAGASIKGKTSYIYTDKVATNNTIQITDKSTVLKSFLATGLDPNKGDPNAGSTNNTASGNNTVPGMTGTGPGGGDGSRGEGDSSGSSTQSGSGSAATGFVQGGSNAASSNMQPETVLSGSLFAVVVAIVGLCVL